MKRYVAVAITAFLGILFFTTTSGAIEDKQAPGIPGHKEYQVKVDGSWKTVPERVWDRCSMSDPYPLCILSSDDRESKNS